MDIYHQRFKTTKQRFWEKVDKRSDRECWEWNAGLNDGYGSFRLGLIHISAHRISWIFHFGSIPDSLYVLHKCDNRKCVNPNHLFLGTHADNMQDMWNKNRHPTENMGRTSETMIGEKNVKARLSERDVRLIRLMNGVGVNHLELSALFGVNKPAIWKIVHRVNWSHVV